MANASRPRGLAGKTISPTIGGLVLALALLPAAASAEEVSGSVTLYGWLPWIDGKAASTSGGTTATTSVSGGDVLEALKFAAMGAGEVHYGRAGFLFDVVYSDLGQDGKLSGPLASDVEVDLEMLLVTMALGYRVYDEGGRLIEPFAGARYLDTKVDVTVTGGGPIGISKSADVEVDWWDPVIGVRGRLPLTEKLTFGGFVDIGGFGAGSEFTWEVFAGLDYALSERFSATAGFRYIAIDYEADAADVDLDFYGPVLGLTMRF